MRQGQIFSPHMLHDNMQNLLLSLFFIRGKSDGTVLNMLHRDRDSNKVSLLIDLM